jgi:ubiquinone/menaquinone biosynthesis C-methylase UbiE
VQAAFALAGDELRSAHTILDAGCGTGWWLERLADDDRVSATLHGLELLPERAALARRRVPSASIIAGDLRALPFADRAFGAATLFTALSSLARADDVRRAITEARRVLEPGGALLIWEPRLPNPLNRSTLLVSESLVREALDGMVVSSRTTTVFPALARRLGRRTEQLYPALARVRSLRTHRLLCALEPGDPGRPASTV